MRRHLSLDFLSEARILVPAVLWILLAISSVTLLSYRNTVRSWAEREQQRALYEAHRVATEIGARGTPTSAFLHRIAPEAIAVALLRGDGQVLSQYGELPQLPPPLDLGQRQPQIAVLEGGRPGYLVTLTPLPGGRGVDRWLRLDHLQGALGAQQRSLRILTWVVLGLMTSLAVLLLLYLRRFLAPFDALVERARQARSQPGSDDNSADLSLLLETMDEALTALSGSTADRDLDVLGRTLIPSLGCGMLLLDDDGSLAGLNRIGAEVLQVDSEVRGHDFDQALATHPALCDFLRRGLEERPVEPGTHVEIEASGRRRILGCTLHPLRHDDGARRGLLLLFADLSAARQRAEAERLSRNLAEMGELAAGVAHELRNSLAVIRGFFDMQAKVSEPERVDAYRREIGDEIGHLQRILDDFLSFARPGSLRLRRTDLVALARRAVASLPRADSVHLSADAPTVAVLADEQLLERAVRNLLANAIEAQQEDGERAPPVELRITSKPGEVWLVIEDSGPGIPEELGDRVFMPFTTTKPEGTGLGLALARRIFDLHDARLSLADRADGHGCRAEVSFPPYTAPADETSGGSQALARSQPSPS